MFPFHFINRLHIKYHTILNGMLPHISMSILYLSSCPAGSLALLLNNYCKKYFVLLILKFNLDCKYYKHYQVISPSDMNQTNISTVALLEPFRLIHSSKGIF
jgi:hypothetical protein